MMVRMTLPLPLSSNEEGDVDEEAAAACALCELKKKENKSLDSLEGNHNDNNDDESIVLLFRSPIGSCDGGSSTKAARGLEAGKNLTVMKSPAMSSTTSTLPMRRGGGPNVANENQTKTTSRRRSKALKKKRVKLDTSSIVKQKKSTCGRRSKKKRVLILKISNEIITDNIRDNLEYWDIIRLLGECVLYESLLLCRLKAEEQERLGMTLASILGEIYVIVYSNYKSLVSLMLNLPQMKKLENLALENLSEDKCDEVASLALKRAIDFFLPLLTVRAYECRSNIRDYCLERIHPKYVPKEPLLVLIEKTFNDALKKKD